jgi:hypothetical protein
MKKSLSIILVLVLGLAISLMAGCSSSKAEKVPFQLDIVPEQLKGHSIAGQKCCFLVVIKEEGQAGKTPVEISAEATGAQVVINHKDILAGQVAEVVVTPDAASTGKSVAVKISGRRGELTDQEERTFEVIEGEDDRHEYAVELQAKFISWLAKSHPELKIGADTEWEGTMVSPQWLVVAHYLFFSEEWEMHIEWHIMIAPYDWVRIDLRHRYDQAKPSYAFEISSREAGSEPIPITLPEMVWR